MSTVGSNNAALCVGRIHNTLGRIHNSTGWINESMEGARIQMPPSQMARWRLLSRIHELTKLWSDEFTNWWLREFHQTHGWVRFKPRSLNPGSGSYRFRFVPVLVHLFFLIFFIENIKEKLYILNFFWKYEKKVVNIKLGGPLGVTYKVRLQQ